MISKISLKEYKSIKDLQANGFHQCIIFKIENEAFKCDTLGGAGLSEILRFRKTKKKLKKEQAEFDLLGLPILQSK